MGGRPVLDEESFTRLLSAAYLMQEHQERSRTRGSAPDLSQIIPQIVETRRLIQKQRLHRDEALSLIAGRLQLICNAVGAAIGLLDNSSVRYQATTGSASALHGASLKLESSLAWHCFNTGENLRSPAAPADPRLDPVQCRKVGAQSLIAVPIYFEGTIGGDIELYFATNDAFQDSHIRACELMAGIVTEVLAQAAEQDLKQAIANERATVLQALERLKPQLQKLAEASATTTPEAPAVLPKAPEADIKRELCRACGHAFAGNEIQCSRCGASRVSGQYPGAELQSKWATLWERQMIAPEQQTESAPVFRKPVPEEEVAATEPVPQEDELPEVADDTVAPEIVEGETGIVHVDSGFLASDAVEGTELASPPHELSSLQPKSWSDTLLGIAVRHGGDISLALSGVVVVAVLLWVFLSKPAPTAAAPGSQAAQTQVRRRHLPKQPQLTLFERVLVGLGIAEPPPPIPYRGEPEVKVWVDLNTGLYYCPGANLYGTTPKGKFTTQEDAQMDAFEPAYRKPCE
jgi:hypothetical protein